MKRLYIFILLVAACTLLFAGCASGNTDTTIPPGQVDERAVEAYYAAVEQFDQDVPGDMEIISVTSSDMTPEDMTVSIRMKVGDDCGSIESVSMQGKAVVSTESLIYKDKVLYKSGTNRRSERYKACFEDFMDALSGAAADHDMTMVSELDETARASARLTIYAESSRLTMTMDSRDLAYSLGVDPEQTTVRLTILFDKDMNVKEFKYTIDVDEVNGIEVNMSVVMTLKVHALGEAAEISAPSDPNAFEDRGNYSNDASRNHYVKLVAGDIVKDQYVYRGYYVAVPDFELPPDKRIVGWVDEFGTPFDIENTPIKRSIALTAILGEYDIFHDVTLIIEGKATVVSCRHGKAVVIPEDAAFADGQSVVWWSANGERYDLSAPVTGSIILTANPRCTLYLDIEGSITEILTAVDTVPIIPSGLSFSDSTPIDHWRSNGKYFDLDQQISNDTTLVAYRGMAVTLDIEGQLTQLAPTPRDAAVTIPSGTVFADGTAVKWWRLNGIQYDITAPVTEDITLTAARTALYMNYSFENDFSHIHYGEQNYINGYQQVGSGKYYQNGYILKYMPEGDKLVFDANACTVPIGLEFFKSTYTLTNFAKEEANTYLDIHLDSDRFPVAYKHATSYCDASNKMDVKLSALLPEGTKIKEDVVRISFDLMLTDTAPVPLMVYAANPYNNKNGKGGDRAGLFCIMPNGNVSVFYEAVDAAYMLYVDDEMSYMTAPLILETVDTGMWNHFAIEITRSDTELGVYLVDIFLNDVKLTSGSLKLKCSMSFFDGSFDTLMFYSGGNEATMVVETNGDVDVHYCFDNIVIEGCDK